MEDKNISDIFLDNYDNLKKYSLNICKKVAMSEDVTQDVFLSIYSRYSKNDEEIANKLGFLYQAIRFSTYNQLKKEKNKNQFLNNEEVIDPLRNDFLLEDLIIKSISEIPSQQKRAFYLKRVLNYKVKEIAEIMKIKPKTVENHITIALKVLKTKYGKYNKE
jgi:RNA polymerase sigma-70 factor (ECF subfamily)